jgi:hypothetical protein
MRAVIRSYGFLEGGFMAARVLHFGEDDRYRDRILEQAGYSVGRCPSLNDLHSSLIQFPETDAVAISESGRIEREAAEAVSLVRSSSAARLVLFQAQDQLLEASIFDLVIAPGTHPAVWLSEIDALLATSQLIRDHSRAIRAQSALTSEQARMVRQRSRCERERSERLLGRRPSRSEQE